MNPYRYLFYAILVSLFCTCGRASFAQNYSCIQANERQYFTNSNGYLRGIRIDSIKAVGTDSIYYPFKTQRNAAWPDTRDGSWVGSKCIVKTDGSTLFDNSDKDTIIILTQAALGESWIFYNDTSTRYFVATVTGIDTGIVLGMLDSIKTIQLTAFTGLSPIITDTLSYFEIKISKHHGFVQIFDLYTFPYHNFGTEWSPSYNDSYLRIVSAPPFTTIPHGFKLSRANSIFTRTAIHNPTLMELYDYAPGDGFARGASNDLPGYSTTLTKEYDSVLQRIAVDPFHVKYVIDHRSNIVTYYYAGPTTSSYSRYTDTLNADTSIVAVYPNDVMPEEMGTFDSVYYYIPFDSTHCMTGVLFAMDIPVLFEGCNYRDIYKSGFGQIEKVRYGAPFPEDIGCHGTYTMSMGMTIKNGILCGSYTVPNKVNELVNRNEYSIYPNPAANEITIAATGTIENIVIYDILGQKKYECEYAGEQVSIDVSNLASGIYLVVVDGIHAGRFVKN